MPSRRNSALALGFLFCAALVSWAAGPGFRSRALLEEHFAKHGPEFGRISIEQYLRLAQDLRDRPPSPDILQSTRRGGFARYDRRNNYFGAYNANGVIRTFFRPNDGQRYFNRQARRGERYD